MKKDLSRRDFIREGTIALGAVSVCGSFGTEIASAAERPGPPVYFIKEITSQSLLRIYSQVSGQKELRGNIAVKLHSGEPGGHHFPDPQLVRDLVQSISGTIVECNTAYQGKRFSTADHRQVLADHGFAAIAPVEVMDENGSISLPVSGGRNLTENFVGAGFEHYDSFLILSHFKGHMMGGYGGAIKNMSIGIASGEGKMWIHTAGRVKSRDDFSVCFGTEQNSFLESMAEAAGSVIDSLEGNLLYINLMNNLSVDCDCDSNPAPPKMKDIGILASVDPVALDRACLDLVYAADPVESADLRKRIESKNGAYTVEYAEKIGLGSQRYELVTI